MKIWIDKQTGTWGSLDELVIVDTANVYSELDEHGSQVTTSNDIIGYLDQASDEEISAFGEHVGHPLPYAYL